MIYSPFSQLLAFGSLAVQVLAACKEPTIRKDWRSLTEDERDRFISAQQELWNRDIDPATNHSIYDREFILLHRLATPRAHNVPAFLPWHRRFLRDYELALQAIDPTVSLPYWNWSADNEKLNTSLIWDDKYFGSNGQGADFCVQNGRFANWTLRLGGHISNPNIDIVHCLRRLWQFGISSPNTWTEVVPNTVSMHSNITAFNGSFEQFSPWLEGHHGTIHMGVGGFSEGANGDMAPVQNSPNEPTFWLHHTFVDKVWADFQGSTPHARSAYGGLPEPAADIPQSDPAWNTSAKMTDIMMPWNITVDSAFFTDGDYYCYTYE